MAEKKVTTMVLDVDLQCPKCYKKVKKILCKFPPREIRDQVYDEKANKVTIKVVCCSPEKIRDKLCGKGGGCIKRIEILPPPPPQKKPPEKKPVKPAKEPKEQPPVQPEQERQPQQPTPPVEPEQTRPPLQPEQPRPAKEPERPKPQPLVPIEPPQPIPPQVPVCYPPPPCRPPMGFCCTDCYYGVPGGPCFRGWPIQYDGYYGRAVYESWGGGGYRSSYASRCDYFREENPQGCSIM